MPRGFNSPCLRNAKSLVYHNACEYSYFFMSEEGRRLTVGVLVAMQAYVEVPDPYQQPFVGSLGIGNEGAVGFNVSVADLPVSILTDFTLDSWR